MKTIELDNSEVIAVFSVFEKLIFLSRDIYELSESDATLLLKAFELIEKKKQPMFKMMYAHVFKELEKYEAGSDE